MSATEPNGPGSSTMKAKASTGTRGSFSGLPEYQLNLDVSLLLKDILEQRGYQVVMTRTDNDTAISNKERAELVASQGAEICVRIHANGDDSADVSGALTMCPSQQNPYVSVSMTVPTNYPNALWIPTAQLPASRTAGSSTQIP